MLKKIQKSNRQFLRWFQCIVVLFFLFLFPLNLANRMHILASTEFIEYKLSHFFLSLAINQRIYKRV